MPTEILTKQFIVDVRGQPIGVILPIEEYAALTQRSGVNRESRVSVVSPLLGALKSEYGEVASTEAMDKTLRELWSVWDSSAS